MAPSPHPIPSAPDDSGAIYEAVADTLATAAAYAETAIRFAGIRDARGLAYATRCAVASISIAAELVAELRPHRRGGGAR